MADDSSRLGIVHEVGSWLAGDDSFQAVLQRIVEFVSGVVPCDSCFIYVLEEEALVLQASKNPHADVVGRLTLKVGQGIAGWVAEHREPVAVATHAFEDPRFQIFTDLPEDRYEAILSVPLLSRGHTVGVINVQHRQPHQHSADEVRTIATIGFLVGAEVEKARLEAANTHLAEQLETRKLLDRAKGILQRDMGLTEEEAYLAIQRQSRQRRRSKKEIAEAIILAEELRRGR